MSGLAADSRKLAAAIMKARMEAAGRDGAIIAKLSDVACILEEALKVLEGVLRTLAGEGLLPDTERMTATRLRKELREIINEIDGIE